VRIRNFEDKMLLFAIRYEGPWAKLSNWCYGINKEGTLLWDIPDDPKALKWVLAKVAHWADDRDQVWRLKYVLTGKEPHRTWKRRP
jgi:hypothetical protein